MKTIRITYHDKTTLTTAINGTMEEIVNYYMQFGGVTVDEDPNTGKETRRYITTIEDITSTPAE